MGNKPGVRHYFAEGITNRGYISLLPNMMSEWEHTYVLVGGPGTGKSTLIKMIGMELLDRGFEVDFLRSARDPDSFAGFILRRYRLGMLDLYEVAPQRWRAPGVVERFVDFSAYCDLSKLNQHRPEILDMEREMSRLEQKMGEILAEDFGEKLRKKSNMKKEDEERGRPWLRNLYATGVIKETEGPWSKVQDALRMIQKSAVNSFFLHGITSEGWLNLAPHYLTDFDQICLEGEETGEAMDWILRESEMLGQVIDIVLHPLYPNEIIGIVFSERNLAIWQGCPKELKDQGLGRPFSETMKETLVQTQTLRSQIKSLYLKHIDFDKVDNLRDELQNLILKDIHSLL